MGSSEGVQKAKISPKWSFLTAKQASIFAKYLQSDPFFMLK